MKILLIALVLMLSGCCPTFQLESNVQTWEGTWYGNGDRESVLTIVKQQGDSYAIHSQYKENEWEGLGFANDDVMIIIFRYKNETDQGYFTLERQNKKKCTFTSYNSNGSFRSDGIILK